VVTIIRALHHPKMQDKSYDKFLSKVAANIIKIRKSLALTQEDMIQHQFSYRHYQRIESGRNAPNLQTLHRLAITFKVDVKDFFK
jgi:transcriptional regulator with XRE-family HTH domain